MALSTQAPIAASISGSTQYSVDGQGSLSFYGPAESSLGVSGDWQNYTASVTGSVSITLTTDALTLNGQTLPAGTYTITAGSATLSGSGATSSPNFAGSVAINATGGTINLGPGTGNLSVAGAPLHADDETTLDGYTGTISVSANGDGTDSVNLNGNAGNVLQVTIPQSTFTTDQNTPITFQPDVQTSLADTYDLTVSAPPGWTVTIDANGNVTATPAPGLQSGTYPIQIIAQSETDSNLEAQTTVEVTITPTQPGITLAVASDPVFTVPFNGAQLPTAFRATIQNLGPAADTYNLTFSNVPSGFTLLDSGTSVTIPAGQTGFLGLYLQVNTGQPIPTAGTQLSFTVTATSTTDPSITETQTETFTVPTIDAVTVTGNPATVNAIPGTPVTDTLTITNVGNVTENNIALTDTLPSGLTLTGLAPIGSLAIGQTTTEMITLTPDASTPLNSMLEATITATYGPSTAPETQTVLIPVSVAVPGAAAIATAALAAGQLGNTNLANQLHDLSTALTDLVQNPTSAVYQSQALASLTAVNGLLAADPYLSALLPALTADGATLTQASTAAAVQSAVSALGNDLDTVGTTLSDEAAHGFTLGFVGASSQIVQPQVPASFQLQLQNTGSQTTTYDLSLSGLPAGVTGSLSQPSITLGHGQVTSGSSGVPALTVTLTSTSTTTLAPISFIVTATAEGASEITESITGALEARSNFVQVTAVTTNPAFTNPGGQVDVTAQILNAVNKEQQALISYTVTDANNNVIYTLPQPVATTLNVLTTLSTVDLGPFDTTGFALGQDTITVTVADASGTPIPGATGTGTILIGTPVNATLSTSPTSLPPGNGTVTTTLQINNQSALPSPLSVISQTAISAAAGVATDGTDAYVGTSGGIDVVDISNPISPSVLSTFGSSDLGGREVFQMQVDNNELVVLAALPLGESARLLIYSLATPSGPTLLGQTPLTFQSNSYQNVVGFSISNNHVYTSALGYQYNTFNDQIFIQFGESLDVDISNPAAPVVDSVIYNGQPNPSDGFPDGTTNVWQTAAVNDQTLLIGSTTSSAANVNGPGVNGVVLVVDTSNPAAPTVSDTLTIPGMAVVTGISVQGNEALVLGSTGEWTNGISGLGGNVVVAMLDLTNPQSPTVISTQTLSVASIGISFLTSLGNNLFVTDSVAGANQAPGVLVFNTSDPSNVLVSQMSVPDNIGIAGFAVDNNLLLTADGSNLFLYNIGQAQETPVTAQVTIPTGGGVSIVPGSFNIAPTAITVTGTGSETLEWDFAFASGDTSETITWQEAVTGLAASQSIPVIQGATVDFSTAPLSVNTVDVDPEVNANILTYTSGVDYPPAGTTLNVGGIPFTLADYTGGGTGVVQTASASPTNPSIIDIPVDVADPTTVYTLINSGYGQLGYTAGAIEFIGTGGADVTFDLVEGQNIRDHNNGSFNNTIAAGTPSVFFGGGQVRFDRQRFALPSSFAGQTLTEIILSGFGDMPTGEPFLAAATVATSTGTVATDTLTLPGQVVSGDEIIGLTPASQPALPGAAAKYTVNLVEPVVELRHLHPLRPGRARELGQPGAIDQHCGGRDGQRAADAHLRPVRRDRR